MSIFSIGTPNGRVLNEKEIVSCTEEDMYFVPGVIHGGEDYLIQAHGYSVGERPEDHRIELKYLFDHQIEEWKAKATRDDGSLEESIFEECILTEAETFIVDNDGATTDFEELNNCWDFANNWNYTDVISWAEKRFKASEVALGA